MSISAGVHYFCVNGFSAPADDIFCPLLLQSQGYVTPVPSDYDDLPQLQGRATVEMVVKKAGGEQFDIEGALYPEAKMKMIIDGYAGELV